MSAGDEEARAPEIIIIRRGGGGEEEGHHGGVWKIAYADFMTAMMAFFLVMWLINSTDTKTLTQVATYFNPLRLTDKVAVSRGVQQETGAQSKQSPAKDSGAKEDATKPHPAKNTPAKAGKQKDHGAKGETKTDAGNAKYTEEALFQDPYAVLSKLAAEAAAEQSRAVPRPTAGEAFRDPFDPAFRREVRPPTPPPGPAPGQAVPDPAQVPAAAPAKAAPADKPAEPPVAAPAEVAKATREQEEGAALRTARSRLEAEIKQIVAQAAPGTVPQIQVSTTGEGILISLTDDYEFGMFAIASAEPRPAMVVVMEKLAKVLLAYPEPLVVRGHTDGRPYKSGSYDNWRLSTARAHMAYYMLVRGGIDDKRFARVEGYADRQLRLAGDPEAAQNRRIEILLSRPKP